MLLSSLGEISPIPEFTFVMCVMQPTLPGDHTTLKLTRHCEDEF